jgi:hypothetical protein
MALTAACFAKQKTLTPALSRREQEKTLTLTLSQGERGQNETPHQAIPMSLRRISRLAALFLLLAGAGRVQAGFIVADFAADLQPDTPTAGWSYLWNVNGGVIGDPANYDLLLAVPQPNPFYYDLDGGSTLPRDAPAAYAFFGLSGVSTQLPGGHPGRGSSQAADGLEHYVIAAYTLSASGQTSIVNSQLTTADASFDGLDVRVFVNMLDTGLVALAGPGFGSSTSFDIDLGPLNAGDTIYVAIGARANDFNDSFHLQYQIEQQQHVVPEPASMTIFGGGFVAMALLEAFRRKRQNSRGKPC